MNFLIILKWVSKRRHNFWAELFTAVGLAGTCREDTHNHVTSIHHRDIKQPPHES